ncbi:MAG: hypothetical protein KF830_16295 [Planctomycetes bacterium]|nr:hypothetical protein [Planctomycetota bacterium]
MRTPTTLALLLLTACAAPPPGVDPEWNAIQQQRLERLRQPRRPLESVVALLGRPPRDLWQDPQPAAVDRGPATAAPATVSTGPRPFRSPQQPVVVRAAVGLGDVAAKSRDTRLDDRARAAFVRASVETGTGAALQAELWSSEDDLFQGTRINDGVAPADARATLRGVDLFPHVRFDLTGAGTFSLPLRAGVFAEWQTIDHEAAGVERRWLSLGPRVVFEPTLRLFGDGADGVDLVGRLGGDFGPAWFDETFRGGADGDSTLRWSGEIGAGLRGQWGALQAELGYGLRHALFGSIDSDLLGSPGRTDLQRQQVFLGGGFRF